MRDVSGFAPYERRILELLRNGIEKRAMKVAKKKVGNISFFSLLVGHSPTRQDKVQ